MNAFEQEENRIRTRDMRDVIDYHLQQKLELQVKAAGLEVKNAQLCELLAECKERLWFVSNTLAQIPRLMPRELSDVIDYHLQQNLELQNKIEEVLE